MYFYNIFIQSLIQFNPQNLMKHQQSVSEPQIPHHSGISNQSIDNKRLLFTSNINSHEYFKIDRAFYDSTKRLISQRKLIVFIHFFKSISMAIFIPINYFVLQRPIQELILVAMVVVSAISFMQGLGELKFVLKIIKNTKVLLLIAQNMNHSIQQLTPNPFSLQESVSQTIYYRPKQILMDNVTLTYREKNYLEIFLQRQIKQILKTRYPKISKLLNLVWFFGLGSEILVILVLALEIEIQEISYAQLMVLFYFIFFEQSTKPMVFSIIIFIIISPILCLVYCCCICCSEKRVYRLPAPVKATQFDITQSLFKCKICFRKFKVGDNIVKLRCNPAHIFHPICIKLQAKINRARCHICFEQIGGQPNIDNNNV